MTKQREQLNPRKFVKYVVINFKGQSSDQRRAAAQLCKEVGADYVMGSEARGMTRPMAEAGFHTHPAVGGSKGLTDVAIYTTRKIHQEGQLFVSANLNRPIAHDRWNKYVRRFKRVTIAGHWNAVIQDKSGGWKRLNNWIVAREARKGAKRTYSHIRTFQQRGSKVVWGLDANWRKKKGSNVKYSPEWIAKKLGLGYINRQVMWLLYDKEHYKVHEVEIIEAELVPTGSKDEHPHPALVVTLEYI